MLGVASFGLELGNDFYEDCDLFEETILPTNRDALIYAAKLAKKPLSLVKGPDIINLGVKVDNDVMTLNAIASDSQLVNGHSTGEQSVTTVQLFVDVHPDDYEEGDVSFEMTSGEVSDVQTSFVLESNLPSSVVSGQHMLFAQAMDSDGYLGPVASVFFDVVRVDATESPTDSPVASSTPAPVDQASTIHCFANCFERTNLLFSGCANKNPIVFVLAPAGIFLSILRLVGGPVSSPIKSTVYRRSE